MDIKIPDILCTMIYLLHSSDHKLGMNELRLIKVILCNASVKCTHFKILTSNVYKKKPYNF